MTFSPFSFFFPSRHCIYRNQLENTSMKLVRPFVLFLLLAVLLTTTIHALPILPTEGLSGALGRFRDYAGKFDLNNAIPNARTGLSNNYGKVKDYVNKVGFTNAIPNARTGMLNNYERLKDMQSRVTLFEKLKNWRPFESKANPKMATARLGTPSSRMKDMWANKFTSPFSQGKLLEMRQWMSSYMSKLPSFPSWMRTKPIQPVTPKTPEI